jgi:hypothetical protein
MALADILLTLVRHDVEFIVVGGMAAVLRGAPVHTDDIDVVYAQDEANVQRLLRALDELDARFRGDARDLRPDVTHLRSTGHKLLRTRHGVLDVLGTIEEATGYEELLPDAPALDVAGARIRVLSVERLIAVKRKLSRPKDQLMLLQLESLLDELRRKP